MNSTQELHQLIRGLGQAEKAYFKKYASLHGSSQPEYMRLFDALAKMTTYDERKLKARFKGSPLAKRLAVERTLLKKALLKALNRYHSGSNLQLTLLEHMGNYHLLIEKGFMGLAQKELQKAFKLAEESEDQILLARLIADEHWFATGQSALQTRRTLIDLNQRFTDSIELGKQYIQLHNTAQQMAVYRQRNYINTSAADKRAIEVLKERIDKMQPDYHRQGLRFKVRYHQFYIMYYGIMGNFEQDYQESVRLLELFKSNGQSKALNRKLVYDTLNNFLNTCLTHYRFDRFEESMQELWALGLEEESKRAYLHQRYHLFRVTYGIHTGNWQHVQESIDELQQMMAGYPEEWPELRLLFTQQRIAEALFMNGQNDKAASLLNSNIQCKSDEDPLPMIVANAMDLRIVINFIWGNYHLIPYLLKTLNTYLAKHNLQNEDTKSFIDFMQRLSKETDKQQQQELLSDYLNQRETKADSEQQRFIMLHSAVYRWAKAQQLGISMQELAAQHARELSRPKRKAA